MRVIAGRLKGRRLTSPRWSGLRPTSDKLRETLFDVLAPRMPMAAVLDGYAGTGAIGIEALSRGAAHVTFIERDGRAVALLQENLRRCGIDGGYAIIRRSIDAVVSRPAPRPFDVVFLDPPYDQTALAPILEQVGDWLTRDGVLVLEHARRGPVPAVAGAMIHTREIISGDSGLAFYARRSQRVAHALGEPAVLQSSTDPGARPAGDS